VGGDVKGTYDEMCEGDGRRWKTMLAAMEEGDRREEEEIK
jgi:hypothetical protein